MTTLVVVKKNGVAAIACDSLTTFGATRLPARYKGEHRKILEVGEGEGKSLIGVCGSSAHHLALTSVLGRDQAIDFNSRQGVFETFRRLHPVLKDEYYLNPKEDDDDPYESSQLEALIANQTGIYSVHSYREAFEYDRFWAAGSGWRYALGALFACYDKLEDPADIARIGVEAGCEFDTSSAGPVVVHTIKLEKSA